MTTPRSRVGALIASLISGVTAVLILTGLPAAPAHAEPSLKDVERQVEDLYHEAEQAQERYHDAQLKLDALTSELTSLRHDERNQDRQLGVVREQVIDSVLRQYQGEPISTVGQVVVADDASAFLGQLSTMSAFNRMQDQLWSAYTTEYQALELRREATQQRTDEIAATTEELAAEQAAVDQKLAEAKEVLAELEAKEREKLFARARAGEAVELPAGLASSGRGGSALSYAMGQVGDRYVYGAAGPSSFDCSGLTMQAWAQAGVSLPHSSSAQFSSGPRVASSDLQPGDLVFYYSPISHVGIYIGNGMIVHAANPGRGVRVDPLYSMPYVGAVRPG